jgi:hypothetical protein
LLVGDDNVPSTESSGDETSDVDIDIWQYHQPMAPSGDWKIIFETSLQSDTS